MSDDIYRTIADHSPFINFVYHPGENQFSYVNPAFNSLTGSEVKASPETILKLIPPDELEYLQSLYKQLNSGTVENIELRLILNNEERWFRITASLISLPSGKTIIGYATDITAENHNLNTLKKYANKKNSVLNILSHDLRGPLGIAKTITQVIDKKIDDPHLINLTQTVSKIIKQSVDMITDLTAREFLETVDVELVKKRINVTAKLREYLEEYQNSQDMSKRTFKFSSSDEAIFLNLDESKFIQVINNLMTNALKFTHDEGVISLDITEQRDSVLFTFADNGIGIPERFHSSLFDEFSDARRKGLNGEPSTGLGLSIVKTIIEWHKGKISFKSKEGEGTTFFVEIPKV